MTLKFKSLPKSKRATETAERLFLIARLAGRTLVRGQIDLTEAERRATPLLMEDLARKITDLLVNEDW